jgi:hypothetical protein
MGTRSDLFQVGAEVELDDWVLGTYQPGSEPGRLQAHTWHGEDGTSARFGWYDSARDNDVCVNEEGANAGGGRCVPTSALLSLGDYTDGACTDPYAITARGCSYKYIFEFDERGIAIHPVNPAAPQPTQRFHFAFNSCDAYPLDTTVQYTTGGPAIPFTMFAGATLRTE